MLRRLLLLRRRRRRRSEDALAGLASLASLTGHDGSKYVAA
jgi:hypothetical protein